MYFLYVGTSLIYFHFITRPLVEFLIKKRARENNRTFTSVAVVLLSAQAWLRRPTNIKKKGVEAFDIHHLELDSYLDCFFFSFYKNVFRRKITHVTETKLKPTRH